LKRPAVWGKGAPFSYPEKRSNLATAGCMKEKKKSKGQGTNASFEPARPGKNTIDTKKKSWVDCWQSL